MGGLAIYHARFLSGLGMLRFLQPFTIVLMLAIPGLAEAQSCDSQSTPTDCNALNTGSVTGYIFNAPAGSNNDTQPYTVNVPSNYFGSGILAQVTGPAQEYAVGVGVTARGPAGSDDAGGGNAEGLTVTNGAQISFAPGGSAPYDAGYAIGIAVHQVGGQGNGGGSTQAPILITNSGLILPGLSNYQVNGAYGIVGVSEGGAAENGGSGGVSQAGGVTIDNIGNIAITGNDAAAESGDLSQAYEAPVANGAAGIVALAAGGAGSVTSHASGDGGAAGQATINDSDGTAGSGGIYVNVQGQGSLPNGVYGILARSVGGAGGVDDGYGGSAGGAAGNATVTVAAGASVDVQLNVGNTVAVPATPDAAISAASLGGAGGIALNGNGASGGNGGGAGTAIISLTDAEVSASAAKNGALAGLLALSQGGAGGCAGTQSNEDVSYPPAQDPACTAEDQNPSQNAGNGGGASNATISVAADTKAVSISTQTTNGAGAAAIEAYSAGGGGGGGGFNANSTSTSEGGLGGTGGNAGTASVMLAASQSITAVADGAKSPAIAAVSAGGAGGLAYGAHTNSFNDAHGNAGGAGGDGGTVTVGLDGDANGDQQQGAISVSTNNVLSPGILAISAAGSGGNGGSASVGAATAHAGAGGDGGTSNNVEVNLYYTTISTTGTQSSPGVLAFSNGGGAGYGGSAVRGASTDPGEGGTGGAAGEVTVTTDANSAITTQGAESVGILAESLGGSGGAYGSANGLVPNTSEAGDGGNAGNVMITNAGSISTTGASARGILAQSQAGIGGGSDAVSWGLFHDDGSVGGTGGVAGTVSVTNSGDITVAQSNTEGVLAQSIGGAGGAGGTVSGVTGDVGGQGGTGSAGNTVTFDDNGGVIATNGYFGIGVLEQSIGGQGGDGGGATGGKSEVGGIGATGADGGAVTANLDQGAAIVTSNDEGDGVVLQSIGGGGGNGGNASSTEVFTASAVGGTGGDAANGNNATGNLTDASITTQGGKASGLVVQSIGGGGGNGGDAEAFSIGIGAAASVALGGTGKSGGAGATAAADLTASEIGAGLDQWLLNGTAGGAKPVCPGTAATPASGTCNTLAVDSYGVVVQSIGGGGGTGGSATAEASAIALPTDGPSISFSINVALGANGGDGGVGGTAQFDLSNGSSIVTAGQGSDGVLAQSIGGGGGGGGDSSEMAAVVGYGSSAAIQDADGNSPTSDAVNINLGRPGAGGNGDDAGLVEAALGGTWGSGSYSGSGIYNGINTFTADPAGSAGTSIVTFGDYADGINAQSVGGGGGDAGAGSGNTQSFGTSRSTALSINLGRTGGSGGDGGTVAVALYAPAGASQVATSLDGGLHELPVGVTTYGSGAIGLLAQSIGGGGGSSQEGSFDLAQSFAQSKTQNEQDAVKISLGEVSGASGGDGGNVVVTTQAPITTHGGDATGVLAQSIGGGGGLGGSAGSDASQDNPVVAALAGREAQGDANNIYMNYLQSLENEDPSNDNPQLDFTFSYSRGGKGGGGGNGGDLSVDIDSAITTGAPSSVGGQMEDLGDWADGVVAQSIGGGGGKGGTSAATGSGGVPEFTINLNYAVGGNGGSGGDGGTSAVYLGQAGSQYVTTGNYGTFTIATNGFSAAGVISQSIGGGGGIAADGSDEATGLISIGGTRSGSAGGGGNGGTAEVITANEVNSSITTVGDLSDGVDVQSIGGGGGIGGAGSTVGVQGAAAWIPQNQQYDALAKVVDTLALYVGGGSSSVGTGGPAVFDSTGGPVNISTTGFGSFGILVQSIGGGGGVLNAVPTDTTIATAIGGPGGGSASDFSAGPVTVNIGENGASNSGLTATNIYNTGEYAFGVVAQSIGSGGGVLRIDNNVATNVSQDLTNEGTGNGNNVTINMSYRSSIDVTNTGSIGIFAQSLGGGGGFMLSSSGLTLANGTNPKGGIGNVSMNLSGSVAATGLNGIAIFAQEAGVKLDNPPNDYHGITIVTSANVTGGTGSGAAAIDILTAPGGPAGSCNSNSLLNCVDVAGGTVSTANYNNNCSGTGCGIAIENSIGNAAAVIALGAMVDGEISGIASTSIEQYGIWNASGTADGDVVNAGTFNLLGKVNIDGDYTQSATGRLGIGIDSLNHAASHLQVNGDADIAGLVVPNAVSLLPGAIPIITADSLNLSAKGLDSLLFDWNLAAKGNSVTFTPVAKIASSGVPLTGSENSVAKYFQKAWYNADPVFAVQFAGFSQINDAGRFTQTLDAYSGKAAEAQSLALINSAGSILGAAMSCPEFGGGTVMMTEDSCVWAKVTTRQDSQWGTGDIQGYHVTDATYRIGGQREVSPGWVVGGSVAGGTSWATTNGTAAGNSSGYGQNYDASVAVKHIDDPWLFAGSVAFAGGAYHSNRLISLPGAVAQLQGSPSVFMAGIRLRAGYEFAFRNWYLRPYGDADLLYSDLPGFTESGVRQYALRVQGSNAVNLALSPMLELGGRFDLGTQTVLHPFAAFGGSFVPGNRRDVDASIVGADAANGTFRSYLQLPGAVANLQAGIQLYHGTHIDLTAAYDAMLGGSYLSQSETAKFSYHF